MDSRQGKSCFLNLFFCLFMVTVHVFAQVDSLQTQTQTDSTGRRTAAPFYFDSTLTLGSAHGHAGDLLGGKFPALYHFDRGSVGLPATAFLFAGSAQTLQLFWDDLPLQDPLTGLCDLNLIPVLGIGQVHLFMNDPNNAYPFMPGSQVLRISSRDLAALPMRSQAAYRTGGDGYDDIDFRAGLRYSQRLRINAGGILKNYAGSSALHEKYRAQKINLSMQRDFGAHWRVQYHLLYNIFDLDLPLHEAVAAAPTLTQPHQKDARFDHGLSVHFAEKWRTAIQLTDLHRERYGYRHRVWSETHDVQRFNLQSEWLWRWRHLNGRSGAGWEHTRLQSDAWGDHDRSVFDVWTALVWQPRPGTMASATLDWRRLPGGGSGLKPQLQLHKSLSERWHTLLWYEHDLTAPALAALHENSPFAMGTQNLDAAISDHLGAGLRYQAENGTAFFLSIAASRIDHETALTWNAASERAVYANLAEQRRLSLDVTFSKPWTNWLSISGKVKQMLLSGAEPLQQPGTFASGYITFHRVFFSKDLDARLHIGCDFWGERSGSIPFYVDESPWMESQKAAAVPWLHAVFIIKDATLFFALQNPLGLEYEVMSAYPMPQQQIRWGFVWNFYD